MPTSSCYQIECESISTIFIVLTINVATNNRHYPLMAFDALVEITDQEMVPHHLALPWIMFKQLSLIILLFIPDVLLCCPIVVLAKS